jgi:hypothetical protein
MSRLLKASSTRQSDIDRITSAFTSGKLSEAMIDFISPLLYPNRNNPLGVREGDVSLWVAVITAHPAVTSLGADKFQSGVGFPDGFDVRAFTLEMFYLLWERVIVAYDIICHNTRTFYAWNATINSHRRALLTGFVPINYLTTRSLTRTVVRSRLSREQDKINRLIMETLKIFSRLHFGPFIRSAFDPAGGKVDFSQVRPLLTELMRLIEDLPTPVPLEYVTRLPENNLFFYGKEVIDAKVSEILYDPRPTSKLVDATSVYPFGKVPTPLVGSFTTGGTEMDIHPSFTLTAVDPLTSSDLKVLARLMIDLENRSLYEPCLPNFPQLSEPSEQISWGNSTSINFHIAGRGKDGSDQVWVNPMYSAQMQKLMDDETYGLFVARSISFANSSMFQREPLSPVVTRHEGVRSPFVTKVANKTSFGLTEHGKAFNRSIDLIYRLRQSISLLARP